MMMFGNKIVVLIEAFSTARADIYPFFTDEHLSVTSQIIPVAYS